MESKNLFFGLGSVLIIIIILSILGVLEPKNINPVKEKEVIIERRGGYYYPPVFYNGGHRKNIVYIPDMYNRPDFYKHGSYARRNARRNWRRDGRRYYN